MKYTFEIRDEIKRCADCPCGQTFPSGVTMYCGVLLKRIEMDDELLPLNAPIPDWCPLVRV